MSNATRMLVAVSSTGLEAALCFARPGLSLGTHITVRTGHPEESRPVSRAAAIPEVHVLFTFCSLLVGLVVMLTWDPPIRSYPIRRGNKRWPRCA